MVGVDEEREFRFRVDLYSQESTFPLVNTFFKTFSRLVPRTVQTCSVGLYCFSVDIHTSN